MGRYIDADELIKTLNREGIPFNDDVNYFILSAPAADVQEVRHGRWEFDFLWYVCSSCGKHISFATLDDDSEPAFCPNCGSRMDLEGEEE